MKHISHLKNYGLHDFSKMRYLEIKKSLTNKFVTNDQFCKKFEKKISSITNSKFALVCNNGTSALMMSILATKIKSIVAIIPNINFVAAASVISLLKGKLIFCDVNKTTGMVDNNSLLSVLKKSKKKKIKPNLFIPIHYAGNYLNTDQLSKICKREKIHIIEDGCHSFGTKMNKNSVVGNSKNSLCTTFSFHPVKNITSIEGGAITTNSLKYYKRLEELRSHSLKKTFSADPYKLISASLNFRMGEINAAVGIEQLKNLQKFKEKRYSLVKYYINKLNKFEKFFKILNHRQSGIFWHLFVILLNSNYTSKKGKFMSFLKKNGIATQIHYKPLSLHKVYKKNTLLNDCGNAKKFYKSQITLPLHTKMNMKDIDRITGLISEFFKS